MKLWKILKTYDPTVEVTTTLLENRGLIEKVAQQEFILGRPLADYFKEFDTAFKKALACCHKQVLTAIKNMIPIVIYGDYDADGVCSTAILYTAIKKTLNYANVTTFIPNRFDHGYGLSKKAIDQILAARTSDSPILFITVDTGITATKEVEYIKSLGHAVIITDHHQKPVVLPAADVILWSDKVVGSTLAFVLARVLGSRDASSLALAALATVTDLIPIFDLNRALVIGGLKVLNSSPPAGIKKLLELSGKKDTKVTAYDLGWVIGPRLNASGRVVDASQSLNLLLETDDAKLSEIAAALTAVNTQRQDKTLEMYEVANLKDSQNLPKVIISASEKYHEGLIGLVAGRLVHKYYRPAIVVSLGEEFAKGSVRSVEGVDIIAFLRQFEEIFINLGGHPMAAGFTIKTVDLAVLEQKVTEFSENIPNELLIPTLIIDLELPLDLISTEFVDKIALLEPYGVGNKEPIFVSRNVGIVGLNSVGSEGQHTSFKFRTSAGDIKGIIFNDDGLSKGITVGDTVDVAYSVSINEFNGKRSPNLMVKDIRTIETAAKL